jgi:hypothetical protein
VYGAYVAGKPKVGGYLEKRRRRRPYSGHDLGYIVLQEKKKTHGVASPPGVLLLELNKWRKAAGRRS